MLTNMEKVSLQVLLGKHTGLGNNFSEHDLRELLLIATGAAQNVFFHDAVQRLAADIQKDLDGPNHSEGPTLDVEDTVFTTVERLDAGMSQGFGVAPSTPEPDAPRRDPLPDEANAAAEDLRKKRDTIDWNHFNQHMVGQDDEYLTGCEASDKKVSDGAFVTDVVRELKRAREGFPAAHHQLDALVEEVGELAQALLQCEYEGKDQGAVYREAVQVCAMAIRVGTEGDRSYKRYKPMVGWHFKDEKRSEPIKEELNTRDPDKAYMPGDRVGYDWESLEDVREVAKLCLERLADMAMDEVRGEDDDD